jgi:CRISPR system Cascade subunit CasE
MYLTRLFLNLRSRQVQRDLANRYELHRTLLRGFPPTLPAGERVLYRVEEDARAGSVIVLLQSLNPPDWRALPEPYLLQPAEVKPFSVVVSAGQMLRFRLLANPTRRIKTSPTAEGEEPSSKRVGLLKEEQQYQWLSRKAEAYGFQLISVRSAKQPDVIGWQGKGKDSRQLTFQSVLFDGVLQVMEPDLFMQALKNGVGPAKGFGFGLLSLAKAG